MSEVHATDAVDQFTAQLDVLNHLAESLRRDQRARPLLGVAVDLLPPDESAAAYVQLVRRATTGLRTMSRLPMIGAPMWRQTALLIEAMRAGKSCRDIYDAGSIGVPGVLDHIREVGAAGEESRTVPKVPFKVVIGDSDVALLGIRGSDDTVLHALRIGPSSLLDDMIVLFETMWSFATPVPAMSSQTPEASTMPTADREMLALLAAGATDDAIARRLGLSLRTVQRRVRKLEDMLGATTRFQAGIQAARRHFI